MVGIGIGHRDRNRDRNRNRIRLALALVALVLPSALRAATVELVVEPSELTIIETFSIRVVVRNPRGEVGQPKIVGDGFEILSSGGVRRSSILGRVSVAFDYTARPKRTGVIEIPPASVSIGGKTVKSPKGAKVRVTKVTRRDDFFMEQSATKTRLYPSQDVTVTLKIYALRLAGPNVSLDPFTSRGTTWPQLTIPWFEEVEGLGSENLRDFAKRFRPERSGDGFLINKLSIDSGFSLFSDRNYARFRLPRTTEHREDSRGVRRSYYVYTITKTLRALEIGTYDLGAVTAQGVIFTDAPGSQRPKPQQFLTQSNPLTIVVSDAPEPRPDSYAGAIGRFRFSAALGGTKREFSVGEPLTLELRITGTGRLEPIAPLDLTKQTRFVESFRIHDQPSIGEITPDGRSKSFFYGVKPKTAGIEAVPPVEFTYFDPESERYVKLETKPIPITVEQGNTVTSADVQSYETGGSRHLNRIRDAVYPNYNSPDALEPREPASDFTWTHAALLAGPPLLYGLLALMVLRRRQLARDPLIAVARDAARKARAELREAGDSLDRVSRALTVFVAERLRLPPGGMTPEECLALLADRGVDADLRDRLRTLFETCEQARFGGGSEAGRKQTGSEAEELLRNLERELS